MSEETNEAWKELYDQLVASVPSKTRKYRLESFENCFIASEAIDYLVVNEYASSRGEAEKMIQELEEQGLIVHVTQDRKFSDGNYYFRFTTIQATRGSNQGEVWTESPEVFQSEKEVASHERPVDLQVSPLDEHNCTLLNNVHPKTWRNPTETKFNLLVIGAGAGGLISAIQAAGLGMKVALIEKHLLGGDCLNIGCVPSKALLRCAKAAKDVRAASKFGVEINGDVSINFAAIMDRMRRLRAKIAPDDSAERYTELGASVFQGRARFLNKHSVEVLQEGHEPQVLSFSKAIVATGGRAAIPPIPGLAEVNYLTNSSLFNLVELPKRLAIIGSGPIGSEMAQAFANFGSEVVVFDRAPRILPREDLEAADVIRHVLEADGVKFVLSANIQNISENNGEITISLEESGETKEIVVDKILISAGRRPNIEGLGLEEAGVKYTDKGIVVKDGLQTTNSNIYAVGDVCLKYQFTHMSDASAKIAFKNAMFPATNEKVSKLVVPWCTYTHPEIAHVGAYEHELDEQGVEYQTFKTSFERNGRVILESEDEPIGFVKMVIKKGSDKILGCTIVGEGAGDMISEVTVCIANNIGAKELSTVIHPYPTTAESIKGCAGAVNKARLTSTTKKALRKLNDIKRLIS